MTPPFTLPGLSDGQLRTLRLAVDQNRRRIQAELIIPGDKEVLPLWEAVLPETHGIANSAKRLLGLTASTGGISQKVSL